MCVGGVNFGSGYETMSGTCFGGVVPHSNWPGEGGMCFMARGGGHVFYGRGRGACVLWPGRGAYVYKL